MKFDATTLHARPEMAAQHKMVDDGSGETLVRNISVFRKNPQNIVSVSVVPLVEEWQHLRHAGTKTHPVRGGKHSTSQNGIKKSPWTN